MSDDHPFASSYLDRHGKRRWRFRRGGKTVALPAAPGDPVFEAAYFAALAGKPAGRPSPTRLPTSAGPRSLRAAWRILTRDTVEWQQLDPGTQATQRAIAERFLTSPVVEGEPLTFGQVDIVDLKRRHIVALLARHSATPHAAAHLLRMIRKLTGVALDHEWIDVDPTYRLKYRPAYRGWKAWSDEARAKFEARWPVGSTPRLAYMLALYFGHRRADVAAVRWSDIEGDGARIVQRKTGKALWLPIHSALAVALAAADRRGETVLVTQYGEPFSAKALGMRMQGWTKAAGLPPGHTLHGLRKTLGKLLAEGGATTRELMATLGHDDIAHAELYSREAEQRQLARQGMNKIDRPALASIKGGKGDG